MSKGKRSNPPHAVAGAPLVGVTAAPPSAEGDAVRGRRHLAAGEGPPEGAGMSRPARLAYLFALLFQGVVVILLVFNGLLLLGLTLRGPAPAGVPPGPPTPPPQASDPAQAARLQSALKEQQEKFDEMRQVFVSQQEKLATQNQMFDAHKQQLEALQKKLASTTPSPPNPRVAPEKPVPAPEAKQQVKAMQALEWQVGDQTTTLRRLVEEFGRQSAGLTALTGKLARLEQLQHLERLKQIEGSVTNVFGTLAELRNRLDTVGKMFEQLQPDVGPVEIVVIGLHSARLDLAPYLPAFQDLMQKQPFRTAYKHYRLGFAKGVTDKVEPVVPLDAPPEKVTDVLFSWPAPAVTASERLDKLGAGLVREMFKEKKAGVRRRCVVVASTECPPPDPAAGWDDLEVDVILLGPDKPREDLTPDRIKQWTAFCAARRGVLVLPAAAPADPPAARVADLKFKLQRLVHPLLYVR